MFKRRQRLVATRARPSPLRPDVMKMPLNVRTELLMDYLNAGIPTAGELLRGRPHTYDLHATNADGQTMLCIAARRSDPRIIQTLLDYEANGNQRNAQGALATNKKKKKKKEDKRQEGGKGRKESSVDENNYFAVVLFFKLPLFYKTKNVNDNNNKQQQQQQQKQGMTPLMVAAEAGRAEAARTLMLSPSVNPDLRVVATGQTALMLAAAAGHTGVVRVLVVLGAQTHLDDETGRTAAQLALANNHPDVLDAMADAAAERKAMGSPEIIRRYRAYTMPPKMLPALQERASTVGLLDALRRRRSVRAARREIAHLARAALVIQRVFRGYRARKRTAALRFQHKYTGPTVVLERHVRGFFVRRHLGLVAHARSLAARRAELVAQAPASWAALRDLLEVDAELMAATAVGARHALAPALANLRATATDAPVAAIVHSADLAGHQAWVADALALDPALLVQPYNARGRTLLDDMLARDDAALLALVTGINPAARPAFAEPEHKANSVTPSTRQPSAPVQPASLLHHCHLAWRAARTGALACLQLALAADPSLATARGPDGIMPLKAALITRHLEAARILLAAAATPADRQALATQLDATANARQETPLQFCVRQLWLDATVLLLEHDREGLDALAQNNHAPLALACSRAAEQPDAALAMVQLLLDHGANASPSTGHPPLMLAVEHRHHELVSLLLARGADPMVQEPVTGNTVLHLCCTTGDLDMLDVFVSGRAQVVQTALEQRDFARAEAITSKCMGIMVPNRTGSLPLDLALQHMRLEAMQYCLRCGCHMPMSWLVRLVASLRQDETVSTRGRRRRRKKERKKEKMTFVLKMTRLSVMFVVRCVLFLTLHSLSLSLSLSLFFCCFEDLAGLVQHGHVPGAAARSPGRCHCPA